MSRSKTQEVLYLVQLNERFVEMRIQRFVVSILRICQSTMQIFQKSLTKT
jgi:hypothetical protein